MALFGIPAFGDFVLNNRLRGQTSDFIGQLTHARSEAMRTATRVTVCPGTSSGCSGTQWENGWVVFNDTNANAAVDSGETVIGIGAALDGATLTVAYRNHVDHSIRLYTGTTDLSGQRVVFDDGTALSQEPGGLDRLHGADLDVMQVDGTRAVSFQDQSLADASAWVGETRFQNRSTQPDGFSTNLVWLDGRYYVVHARLRTDPDGVTRFSPVVTALAEAN